MRLVRWLLLIPLIFSAWWIAAIVSMIVISLVLGSFSNLIDLDISPEVFMPIIGSICAFSVVITGYKVAPSHKKLMCWLSFSGGMVMLILMFRDLLFEIYNGDFTNLTSITWFTFPLLSGLLTAYKLAGVPRLTTRSSKDDLTDAA